MGARVRSLTLRTRNAGGHDRRARHFFGGRAAPERNRAFAEMLASIDSVCVQCPKIRARFASKRPANEPSSSANRNDTAPPSTVTGAKRPLISARQASLRCSPRCSTTSGPRMSGPKRSFASHPGQLARVLSGADPRRYKKRRGQRRQSTMWRNGAHPFFAGFVSRASSQATIGALPSLQVLAQQLAGAVELAGPQRARCAGADHSWRPRCAARASAPDRSGTSGTCGACGA